VTFLQWRFSQRDSAGERERERERETRGEREGERRAEDRGVNSPGDRNWTPRGGLVLYITEMNEMRHVLTALKSPTRSSTLSNGAAGVATTTWYDVPAPVIVHCRDFHEEVERKGKDRGNPCERSANVETLERERSRGCLRGGTNERHERSLEKDVTGRLSSADDEALYQNNVEAALNSLSKICSESSKFEVPSLESCANDSNRKRRSTTLELNATTTVKTDADGIPTISFSFLRTDDKFQEDPAEEIVILEVDTSDEPDCSANQLYDFPKNTLPGNGQVCSQACTDKNEVECSSPAVRQDLYDMPKSMKEMSLSRSREENAPADSSRQNVKETASAVVAPNRRNCDQTKRSTRSLKSGRRSYGASDSDGYDAGIASMSGSYSDPECPNEEVALSVSGESSHSKRLKLQKRRLGKAWGRMRSWLREEKTRIGEVVNRHARLQAVGALTSEVAWKTSGSGGKREKQVMNQQSS
jgi:hypothetical protein